MEHIAKQIERAERNMKLNTADPVALHGFTQVPNFILRDPNLSIGAKTIYSLLLSYAWHNDLCFPGQDRLAKDVGMGLASVNRFVKELEACALIEITRRGQGRTNFYTINFIVKKQGRKS
ncbi:MAG: helix-turn-helix domain-containing protein [Alphaproteobacteria bacterium]|nr:helix-turn-helix domain-containing protein [Alphaproteobacteria bacterium]